MRLSKLFYLEPKIDCQKQIAKNRLSQTFKSARPPLFCTATSNNSFQMMETPTSNQSENDKKVNAICAMLRITETDNRDCIMKLILKLLQEIVASNDPSDVDKVFETDAFVHQSDMDLNPLFSECFRHGGWRHRCVAQRLFQMGACQLASAFEIAIKHVNCEALRWLLSLDPNHHSFDVDPLCLFKIPLSSLPSDIYVSHILATFDICLEHHERLGIDLRRTNEDGQDIISHLFSNVRVATYAAIIVIVQTIARRQDPRLRSKIRFGQDYPMDDSRPTDVSFPLFSGDPCHNNLPNGAICCVDVRVREGWFKHVKVCNVALEWGPVGRRSRIDNLHVRTFDEKHPFFCELVENPVIVATLVNNQSVCCPECSLEIRFLRRDLEPEERGTLFPCTLLKDDPLSPPNYAGVFESAVKFAILHVDQPKSVKTIVATDDTHAMTVDNMLESRTEWDRKQKSLSYETFSLRYGLGGLHSNVFEPCELFYVVFPNKVADVVFYQRCPNCDTALCFVDGLLQLPERFESSSGHWCHTFCQLVCPQCAVFHLFVRREFLFEDSGFYKMSVRLLTSQEEAELSERSLLLPDFGRHPPHIRHMNNTIASIASVCDRRGDWNEKCVGCRSPTSFVVFNRSSWGCVTGRSSVFTTLACTTCRLRYDLECHND